MQNLPIITNPSDVSVYKFERKSIFRYLRQIEELFEKETGGKELGLFLAEPLENDFNKKISWSTKAEGPIRNMSQLSQGEKDYVASKVQEYSDEIKRIASKLEATHSASSFISAEILDNLLITRELPEALFLVGNQVVITEWGCAPYGRYDRKNFELTKQIKKIVPEYVEPPPIALPRATVPPDLVDARSTDAKTAVAGNVDVAKNGLSNDPGGRSGDATVVNQSGGFSLWRWVVILLLLALLIFGLSLKSCSRFNQIDNGSEEAALRSEINSLWVKVKEKAQACLPKLEGTAPTAPQATTPPSISVDQKKFEKKDLSVFEGNWIFSGANIVEFSSRQRIVMQLKFGSDGSAVSTVKTEAGDICSAGASAVINSEKQFTVKTNTLNCKRGGTWTMSKSGRISCVVRPNYTQADCTLMCESGPCTGLFERSR